MPCAVGNLTVAPGTKRSRGPPAFRRPCPLSSARQDPAPFDRWVRSKTLVQEGEAVKAMCPRCGAHDGTCNCSLTEMGSQMDQASTLATSPIAGPGALPAADERAALLAFLHEFTSSAPIAANGPAPWPVLPDDDPSYDPSGGASSHAFLSRFAAAASAPQQTSLLTPAPDPFWEPDWTGRPPEGVPRRPKAVRRRPKSPPPQARPPRPAPASYRQRRNPRHQRRSPLPPQWSQVTWPRASRPQMTWRPTSSLRALLRQRSRMT